MKTLVVDLILSELCCNGGSWFINPIRIGGGPILSLLLSQVKKSISKNDCIPKFVTWWR